MKKFILLSVFVITCATFSKSNFNSFSDIGGTGGSGPKNGGTNGGGITFTSNY